MYDPVRDILAELAAAPAVSVLAGNRIRRFEPAPGDARGPGEWVPFVVLVRLGGSRPRGRLPVQQVPIGARCYGRSDHEATALAGAVVDALDNAGPRGAIYRTYVPEVGETLTDPDTGQPYAEVVIESHTRKE
jgi:hypothetical protein